MERTVHPTRGELCPPDQQIWERVEPGLEPYPAPLVMEAGRGPDAVPGAGSVVPVRSAPIGGIQDPCCMGSAAAEMLQVIQGFLEEELLDRRHDLMLARQAPSFARSALRGIAAAAESRARQLMAAYYLITGRCPQQPALGPASQVYLGRWCPALRERYHAEVCTAMNYTRAAEGTTDPCLARLFRELSAGADQDARQLMILLERTL